MSESRTAFIALAEEDPELRPFVPLLRAILEAPAGSLSAQLSLLELWSGLKADRRALLAMTLDESLTVGEIAKLARVHPRTLYKSRLFRTARSRIRAHDLSAPPHGEKSFDDSDGGFDAWEDD